MSTLLDTLFPYSNEQFYQIRCDGVPSVDNTIEAASAR